MTGMELAQRLFFEGLDCLDREDYANAEKHFRKAYEILPERLSVIDNLTGVLVKLKRIDEARRLAKKSLSIDEGNALAWLNLGTCLQEGRDYAAAADAFRRALALDETLHEAWRGLGSASAELGDWAQAAKASLVLLRRFPRSARLLYSLSRLPKPMVDVDLLALIDQAEPDDDESREEFETLCAFARAAALDKAGRYDDAWQWLTVANRRAALALSDERDRALAAQDAALARAQSFAVNGSPADGPADDGPVSLFILGPSQSGKTTLERLIAAADGVVRGGESLIVEDAVSRTCRNAGRSVCESIADLPPALYGACRDVYRRVLRDSAGSARFYTNTLPGQINGALQIAAALPNTRFVILKRDRDDLALRIFMKKYRTGNAYAYDIGDIGKHIAWYRRMTDIVAERLADRSIVVRYEEMIADPGATMRSLAGLCSVEPPDGRLPNIAGDIGCAAPYRERLAAAWRAADGSPAGNGAGKSDGAGQPAASPARRRV